MALALGGAAQAASFEQQAAQVQSRTLTNGLQVLVWPDHDIPTVALELWYRVGARNEGPGHTGLSHFFEHMMFRGTARWPDGEFDRAMQARGGANNAHTSADVTVYEEQFPADALDLILQMEADRMVNLGFEQTLIDTERGAVQQERSLSVDNEPLSALFEQVLAVGFLAHPYRNPVIGWPSDIAAWTLDDLRAHYRRYYAPNNATLVVVGDVDPEAVFARAEAVFGPLPAQPAPPPLRTVEPPQQGERRLLLQPEAGQTPALLMAYRAPAAGDADWPALDLLAEVLAGGESSRLHRRLVTDTELALQTGVFSDPGFDPGLIHFYALLPPGSDPAPAEAEMSAVIARLAEQGLPAEELDRARRRWLAAYWGELAQIEGKARQLGTYATFGGDWRRLFAAAPAIEAVTTTQVQALARRLLRPSQRTVGVLRPATPEATDAQEQAHAP